jgi:hypothetical protein
MNISVYTRLLVVKRGFIKDDDELIGKQCSNNNNNNSLLGPVFLSSRFYLYAVDSHLSCFCNWPLGFSASKPIINLMKINNNQKNLSTAQF